MTTAPTSTYWRMADQLAGGRLEAILTEARSEGRSGHDIARQLHTDHGIAVSATTVYSWLRALDPEEASA